MKECLSFVFTNYICWVIYLVIEAGDEESGAGYVLFKDGLQLK